MRENYSFLDINPLKDYSTPKYPDYILAYNNPDLLKKLPSRWQKNAKVIACIGLMGGTLSMTNCISIMLTGNRKCSNCGFPHLGGSGGSAPIYVVYLTEQEAHSVMLEKWKSLGFDFNSTPPEYTVNAPIIVHRRFNEDIKADIDVGIDYFNEEKNVGISLVSRHESGKGSCYDNNKYTAEIAAQKFVELDNNIDVGVMYNPKNYIGLNEPSKKEREKAEATLKAQLANQVQEFLEWYLAK
jgi:hypothetical protein